MDHHQLCHGSFKAIPVLDAVAVEPAYGYSALHYQYNEMFNHMGVIPRALAKKMTQWKEDLYFAVQFACQKLSKYYTEVTSTMGMHQSSTCHWRLWEVTIF